MVMSFTQIMQIDTLLFVWAILLNIWKNTISLKIIKKYIIIFSDSSNESLVLGESA